MIKTVTCDDVSLVLNSATIIQSVPTTTLHPNHNYYKDKSLIRYNSGQAMNFKTYLVHIDYYNLMKFISNPVCTNINAKFSETVNFNE